jgi:hypothetical protein
MRVTQLTSLVLMTLAVSAGRSDAQVECLIPADEIVSGGVGRDGIPALTSPDVVSASEGDAFLRENDLVLGVVVNGEARAYPHAILWWHEIVNDVLRGRQIVVSFCPLTGSGLAHEATFDDRALNFGVSGLLFDNNLLLFDRSTGTLWSQMKAQAVCGPMQGTAQRLLPIVQTTWSGWKALHRETTTLSFNTGFDRNYNRYPYGTYDDLDSDLLLFPHSFIDDRLPLKETVLGITHEGVSRAYPTRRLALETPAGRGVVNDFVNGLDVLVVFDGPRELALPFRRRLAPSSPDSEDPGELLTFEIVDESVFPFQLRDNETGTIWSVTGLGLEGDLAGAQLQPVATYSAFWFAWASFHLGTEVFLPTTP